MYRSLTAITLISLLGITSGKSFVATLSILNKERETLNTVTQKVVYGTEFSIEIPLGKSTDYVQYSQTAVDGTCAWYYQLPSMAAPAALSKQLGACDYPTRTITTKKMSLEMPVLDIPDFDQTSTLILQCQSTATTLKKSAFECDKVSEGKSHGRSYWAFSDLYQPSSEEIAWVLAGFYGFSATQIGVYGSSYCVSLAADVADISFYAVSSDVDFVKSKFYYELLGMQFAASAMIMAWDGYKCIDGLTNGDFWTSETHAVNIFTSGSTTFSFDFFPDVLLITATLIQILSTFMYADIAEHFLWVEMPRLIVDAWKLSYELLN